MTIMIGCHCNRSRLYRPWTRIRSRIISPMDSDPVKSGIITPLMGSKQRGESRERRIMMCLILGCGIRAMRFWIERLRSFRNFICSPDGMECAVKKRGLEIGGKRKGALISLDFCRRGQKRKNRFQLHFDFSLIFCFLGRRPNGFLGLSLNDRTILVLVPRQSWH